MRIYSLFAMSLKGLLLSATLSSPLHAETILIMFEEDGCPYCDLWKEQIGPIYPKTSEGAIAPIMMLDISEPLPEGISINSRPIYTPTFVLIDDGQEIDRLLGYPGEDFFWFLVDKMLDKLPEQPSEGNT